MARNRRTATIIITTICLLASVAVAAYLAGRSGRAADPSTSPTDTASRSTTRSKPNSASADPKHSQSPGLTRGVTAAGEGGRSKGPGGIPLGYQHDRGGAVAAATNYLIWMNSIKITDKRLADAMAEATAVDNVTRSALVQSFDGLRSGMDDLTADCLEPARGAYAIAEYFGDRATVYVWAPEVITETSRATDHVWGIDAVRVVWADNDWKLDGDLITSTGGAAIDPSDVAGNPSAAEKRSILSRTPADPGEITDAAQQTWLEYANAPG